MDDMCVITKQSTETLRRKYGWSVSGYSLLRIKKCAFFSAIILLSLFIISNSSSAGTGPAIDVLVDQTPLYSAAPASYDEPSDDYATAIGTSIAENGIVIPASQALVNKILARCLKITVSILKNNGYTISNSTVTNIISKFGMAFKSQSDLNILPQDPVEYICFSLDIIKEVLKDELSQVLINSLPQYKITALGWIIDLTYNDIKGAILAQLGHPIPALRATLVDNTWLLATDIGPSLVSAAGDAWKASSMMKNSERFNRMSSLVLSYMSLISKANTLEAKKVLFSLLDQQFIFEKNATDDNAEKNAIEIYRITSEQEIRYFDSVQKYKVMVKKYLAGDGPGLNNYLKTYFPDVEGLQILADYSNWFNGVYENKSGVNILVATFSGEKISAGTISITGADFGTNGKVQIVVPLSIKIGGGVVGRVIELNNPSWSKNKIDVNIFQNGFTLQDFDQPVQLIVYNSNNDVIGKTFFPFSDVNKNDWSACYIQQLWKSGIVSGKGNGAFFDPKSNVSRAEFLKIVMKSIHGDISYNYKPVRTLFPDVTVSDWYAPYVDVAKNQFGIITGKPCSPDSSDKCFWPNEPITRFEAVAIIKRTLNLSEKNVPRPSWSDVNTSQNNDIYIVASYKGNSGCTTDSQAIISGYSNTKFGTNNYITREESAKMISIAKGVQR